MRTGSRLVIMPAIPLVAVLLAATHSMTACDSPEPAGVAQWEVTHKRITQADIDALPTGESLSVDLGEDHVLYHFQLDSTLDLSRILLLSSDGQAVRMDVVVAEMQARQGDPLTAAEGRLVLTGNPSNFVELTVAKRDALQRDGTLVVDPAGAPRPTPQSTDPCASIARYDRVVVSVDAQAFRAWSEMHVVECPDECVPDSTTACYTGAPGTEGVGPCHGGQKKCLPDGTGYGPCTGQVRPEVEFCASAIDLDCNGATGCTDGHLWSRRIDSYGTPRPKAITSDAAGNVLVTGSYFGTLDFGGTPLVSNVDTEGNGFLVKLDPAGNTLWTKDFGDRGTDIGLDVATDSAGNVILVGSFRASVNFGAGPLTTAGDYDAFVAKFSPSGALLWNKRYGDVPPQHAFGVGIDGADNIVVTGWFGGTIDFGAGPLTATGTARHGYLAKLDPDGNALWSKQFDNTAVRDLAVNASGAIALTGTLAGTIDFGGGPLTSAGSTDVVVAEFDAGGGPLWSKRFGGVHEEMGKGVAFDGAEVVITGQFADQLNLGGGPLTSLSTNAFAARFDGAGNLIWSRQFPAFAFAGNEVAVDTGHQIVLTGVYRGNGSFGDRTLQASTHPIAWANPDNRFVVKLDAAGNLIWSKGFAMTDTADDRGIAVDATGRVLYTGYLLGTVDYGGGPQTSEVGFDLVIACFAP